MLQTIATIYVTSDLCDNKPHVPLLLYTSALSQLWSGIATTMQPDYGRSTWFCTLPTVRKALPCPVGSPVHFSAVARPKALVEVAWVCHFVVARNIWSMLQFQDYKQSPKPNHSVVVSPSYNRPTTALSGTAFASRIRLSITSENTPKAWTIVQLILLCALPLFPPWVETPLKQRSKIGPAQPLFWQLTEPRHASYLDTD